VLAAIFFSSNFSYCQQVQKVSPGGTKFFIYTPNAASAGAGPYPLLLSLHGQGNIGDNLNELLDVREIMPAKLIHENKWPENYPFIVVTPQLKPGTTLSNSSIPAWPPELVNELVGFVLSTNNIDTNRIYLTGFSMGGTGVWDYAIAYPERITAMVPIAGRTDSTQACRVKNIPTWVFHGSNDPVVPPTTSTSMVKAINACQPHGKYVPQLTLLYAQQHEGWSGVYDNSSNYNIYEWLLQFSKNNQANKPPYVNAGADLRIVRHDEPLQLYGEFFDIDGTVAKIQWIQTAGPSLVLEETTSRFLKVLHPAVGNFEFELQVTDNQGAQRSDRVKVEIVNNASSFPEVTDLILSSNGKVIGELRDSYHINPDSVGTDKINIRAVANTQTSSVRFKVNGNHNLRTADTPGSFLLSTLEWKAEEGEYLICATPYSDKDAHESPGVSLCFKIIISREVAPPVITGLNLRFHNSIKLYPNPSSDWIHLQAESTSPIDQLTIVNALGIEVYKSTSGTTAFQPTVSISVDTLSPGIYFAVLSHGKTSTTLKFIVK
jgi:predicted esterase